MSSPNGMVIFDLDGTLTVPALDFDAIRAEIGLPPGPILESLERLRPDESQHAKTVLARHEEKAARESRLHDGATETVAALRASGRPVAILTRNARKWTSLVLQKHSLTVDAVRTRDDGVVKPSPDPIVWLCTATGCDPAASWMVGDHLFDLQSGRAAGCHTVLMAGKHPPPQYAAQADHVIEDLRELLPLIAGP